MPITNHKNYPFSFSMIDIKNIDPSPYQHRKYFDEESLRELGTSIAQDGLIEPVIVRLQKNGQYQLISGERRLRAIKDYTDMTMIQAKIVVVDDLQARRISAAENLLREDLSAIESIEATIEIIDVEMDKEPEYLTVGKTPLERVVKLLSKLDSIRVSKDRGSMVSKEADDLFHKFMEQVELIFKNLPKPLQWRSFLNNDLILLTDIPSIVQTASVKHGLNKAQTKALAKLEQVSGKVFHEVIQKGFIPFKDQNNNLLPINCSMLFFLYLKTKNLMRYTLFINNFILSNLGVDLLPLVYFKKMAAHYMKGSISDFSKAQYLNFFKDLFCLMKEHSKPSTRIAFLNADFRDFQGIPAFDEDPENAILVLEYANLLETCGWKVTHLIDCPLSTERFTGNMVNRMQEKRTLGIVRRTLIIGKLKYT
ncbi:MAG: ParB/RepB/Spo0J family partition protein [Deltaproteobacteria bacterium]|uniref:ParB/RepB/Spo0J family partition protein n=1 Tax=Desulfobacula sp. TaxID=2593537 RepID=UPI0019BAF5EE|nr:ParB/RepB/Spo0J family partition protein [Candidatus Desulfobacula maris]MBL6995577.1 ParB/RepB/Spo0J family partition protein [Desulfobacula sp.]